MAHASFNDADFLDAALALAASGGPSAVTVAAITARLGAPTGSFYHRFASRDALLGQLWVETLLAFQVGIAAALDGGDGLAAALHTPAWVRARPDGGRLLMLYHRDDFIQGDWPQEITGALQTHGRRAEARLRAFARSTFGQAGPDEVRRARFAIASAPVAAVTEYLRRGEPPPPIVDTLIEETYRAVIDDHRASLTERRNLAHRSKGSP